jgi:hypothetical protein
MYFMAFRFIRSSAICAKRRGKTKIVLIFRNFYIFGVCMTRAETSKKIELACAEVLEKAPKARPMGNNWNPHRRKKEVVNEIIEYIEEAAKKYCVSAEALKTIILR